MQLFTHLLSSYLQGMGDFFSALPRGRNTMSMDSFMNGHLFSLDDYASPISTLYLSATHSITPVTFGSALP